MKCEWVRENITLHVYGELADDARHELEQHVSRCADCAAELKAEREFHALLSQVQAEEPSPNLLAASRMKLQEALETVAFTKKRIAPVIHKVLTSALDNAKYLSDERGLDLDVDNLYVKTAIANNARWPKSARRPITATALPRKDRTRTGRRMPLSERL